MLIWLLFGYSRQPRRRADAAPSIRSPSARRRAAAARAAAADQPARRTCADLRAHEDELLDTYGWVDKNAGVVRIPIDEAMKLTLQRGLPARQGEPMTSTDAGRTTRGCAGSHADARLRSCFCASCRRRAAGVARRWRRRRARRLQARAGHAVVRACRAPLREIGFDQNLDQPRAARHHVHATKPAATVQLGDYFGTRPVVLVFVYYDCPMLCTQVINGAGERARRAVARAGQGLRDRHRQLRPARHAGDRGRQEGRSTSSATSAPGAADGWHFLTGEPAVDRAR